METSLQDKTEVEYNKKTIHKIKHNGETEVTEITYGKDDKKGIKYSEEIIRKHKDAKIIILALSIQREDIIPLLTIGVQDIIHKHSFNPSQEDNMLFTRIKKSLLNNQKYDASLAKSKILSMSFNSFNLNQTEIDDILKHSKL